MKEGDTEILRQLADFEDSCDMANDFPMGWTWRHVRVQPGTLNRLFQEGYLDNLMKTNSYTGYRLSELGRQIAAEAKAMAIESEGPPPTEGIDESIFDIIVGYEEDKKQLVKAVNRVIAGKPPIHFLFEGVPATAKSTFIDCLADTLRDGMYPATGANTTESGLAEVLMRGYIVLSIDEIDFLEPKAMSVLLRFMETGDILQTKHRRTGEHTRHRTMVIGACNSVRKLSGALLSRFYPYHLYFPPYSRDDFVEVCKGLLTKREGIASEEVAAYIAERLYSEGGQNTDPRSARGVARMLEEGTKEEVDEQIDFLKKRGKYFR